MVLLDGKDLEQLSCRVGFPDAGQGRDHSKRFVFKEILLSVLIVADINHVTTLSN